jgi:IS1 family transposase
MANNLSFEKQCLAISALAEGSSIRSVERMTGIHRDTIMRLGVRVGEACEKLMDETMRELPCQKIEVDEIWGFVGKKQKMVLPEDSPKKGDVWTFVAIDPETKVVPAFHVGKRDYASTDVFVSDVSNRMKNRIQLSSDAMIHYAGAVEKAWGGEVDYGQLIKVYRSPEANATPADVKYSPPVVDSIRRNVLLGNVDPRSICTSYVARQNLTMRMHCRRLTRLTNAFSKKLENFRSAVGLHFGYYNFVKMHSTIRCTPAMAAGVSSRVWKVDDLVSLAV